MATARRILILPVKAGAGHLRAAQAIEQAFAEEHPEAEVLNLEALEYTNEAFRRAFTGAYETLAKELPSIWGYIYDTMEEKNPNSRMKRVAQIFDNLNARPLWNKVKEFDPHAVVCTHYMPAEVLGAQRAKGALDAPVFVTLTDYDIHSMWIQPGVDTYFVATEEMAHALQSAGVDADKTCVAGIPILPVFSADYGDRAAMRQTLGLRPDARTLLVSAGGFGLGEVDKTVDVLADSLPETQFVAIAGRSEALHKALQAVADKYDGRVKAFGFVDNMHELMAASDLAVTKCGGLTSSECLAMGLPMVIVRPIPGQEDRNADFLLENGVAVRANSNAHTIFKVKALMRDPERLERMSAAARAAAHPRAAYTIADTVMKTARDGE